MRSRELSVRVRLTTGGPVVDDYASQRLCPDVGLKAGRTGRELAASASGCEPMRASCQWSHTLRSTTLWGRLQTSGAAQAAIWVRWGKLLSDGVMDGAEEDSMDLVHL